MHSLQSGIVVGWPSGEWLGRGRRCIRHVPGMPFHISHKSGPDAMGPDHHAAVPSQRNAQPRRPRAVRGDVGSRVTPGATDGVRRRSPQYATSRCAATATVQVQAAKAALRVPATTLLTWNVVAAATQITRMMIAFRRWRQWRSTRPGAQRGPTAADAQCDHQRRPVPVTPRACIAGRGPGSSAGVV